MEKCIAGVGKVDKSTGYYRVSIKGTVFYQHRISYQKANPNEDIKGKIIHHTCRNKGCINPKHLISISRKKHSKEHGLSGISKLNSEKTVCKLGHALKILNNGKRICIICKRKSAREYSKRNRDRLKKYKRNWRKENRVRENEKNRIYLKKWRSIKS